MTTSNDSSATSVSGTSPPRRLEDIEVEIAKCQKDCEQSFLAIGRLLLEAKEEVGKKKGDWIKWLQDHVDFSVCKAQRLMRVAKWIPGRLGLRTSRRWAHVWNGCMECADRTCKRTKQL